MREECASSYVCVSVRLDLAPTPTREKRTRGHRDTTVQQPHSKKTKRSQELSSSSSAVGSIQITDVDPEGRFIQIRNSSDKVCSETREKTPCVSQCILSRWNSWVTSR